MDELDRILSSLPKGELSGRADRTIKNRLYLLIRLDKFKGIFSLNTFRAVFSREGMAVAFSVVIIFGAASIYAYASPGVIPGNHLYPLKLALENIEQKISVNTPAKIATYEKLSNRRLQEAVALQSKVASSTAYSVAISNSIKNNINSEVSNHLAVVNSINTISDSVQANDAISQAKQNDLAEINYLNKIAQNAIANGDSGVVSKVDEAKAIIGSQQYNNRDNHPSDNKQTPSTSDKAAPSYSDYIKNKPAYRSEKNSTTTATSTNPVMVTSTEAVIYATSSTSTQTVTTSTPSFHNLDSNGDKALSNQNVNPATSTNSGTNASPASPTSPGSTNEAASPVIVKPQQSTENSQKTTDGIQNSDRNSHKSRD